MTRDELIAALAPSRLPPAVLMLDWRMALALIGLGLMGGAVVVWLLSPFFGRRVSLRARIRATRGLEPEERLLAIARLRGGLPQALRPAAYRAAPMPSEAEVERLSRGRE